MVTMSSPETMPPALPSMWRALKRGYQAEPRLLLSALVLALLASLPDALLAIWLKLLTDGVLKHHRLMLIVGSLGLAASVTATWFFRVVSDRVQRRFRDQVTIVLETQVAHLQASIATLEHHERPDYLDRLAVLRDQVFVLDHIYMSIFSVFGLDPPTGCDGRPARFGSSRACVHGGLRDTNRDQLDGLPGNRTCRGGTRSTGDAPRPSPIYHRHDRFAW